MPAPRYIFRPGRYVLLNHPHLWRLTELLAVSAIGVNGLLLVASFLVPASAYRNLTPDSVTTAVDLLRIAAVLAIVVWLYFRIRVQLHEWRWRRYALLWGLCTLSVFSVLVNPVFFLAVLTHRTAKSVDAEAFETEYRLHEKNSFWCGEKGSIEVSLQSALDTHLVQLQQSLRRYGRFELDGYNAACVTVLRRNGEGIALTSEGARKWNRQVGARDLLDITWVGDGFVGVGRAGRIYGTRDGSTWQLERLGGPDIQAVAWSGSWVVAVDSSGGVLRRAAPQESAPTGDESTRPQWVSGPKSPGSLRRLASGGGRWVGLGEEGTILASEDGLSWQPANVRRDSEAGSPAASFSDVVWSEDTGFLAVGGTESEGVAARSLDGLSWSTESILRAPTDPAVAPDAGSSTSFRRKSRGKDSVPPAAGIKRGSGKFVMMSWDVEARSSVSWDTYVVGLWTSADGRRWTQRLERPLEIQAVGNRVFLDLEWSGSQFVAVVPGALLTSSDGVSWRTHDQDTSLEISSVASGPVGRNGKSKYVAVTANELRAKPLGQRLKARMDHVRTSLEFWNGRGAYFDRYVGGLRLLVIVSAAIGALLILIRLPRHLWLREFGHLAEDYSIPRLTLPQPGWLRRLDHQLLLRSRLVWSTRFHVYLFNTVAYGTAAVLIGTLAFQSPLLPEQTLKEWVTGMSGINKAAGLATLGFALPLLWARRVSRLPLRGRWARDDIRAVRAYFAAAVPLALLPLLAIALSGWFEADQLLVALILIFLGSCLAVGFAFVAQYTRRRMAAAALLTGFAILVAEATALQPALFKQVPTSDYSAAAFVIAILWTGVGWTLLARSVAGLRASGSRKGALISSLYVMFAPGFLLPVLLLLRLILSTEAWHPGWIAFTVIAVGTGVFVPSIGLASEPLRASAYEPE